MSKKVMKLASRGKRLGGYAIDAVLPVVVMMILMGLLIALATFGASAYNSYGYGYGYGYDYQYNQGPGVGSVLGIMVCIILLIAYLGVQVFFFTKSQTIGKAVLGMKVVDSATGEPIGVWRMILREWFAKGASASAFMLGYLWVAIDDKNRGWHDKIVDSYVVDIHESSKLSAGAVSENAAESKTMNADSVTSQENNNEVVEKTVEPADELGVSEQQEETEASVGEETSQPADIQCDTEVFPE